MMERIDGKDSFDYFIEDRKNDLSEDEYK